MRTSDCCTSSREVTRPSRSAACISGMVASTTLKGGLASGFFAASAKAARRRTTSRVFIWREIVWKREHRGILGKYGKRSTRSFEGTPGRDEGQLRADERAAGR